MTTPVVKLQYLSIECTRKCNMNCAFCLRGDAQDKDLNPDALDRLFSKIKHIDSLCPTGGEPSLNPKALKQIKNSLIKNDVYINGIYLVTNGLNITNEFILNFMDLLLLTNIEEEYYNTITLSKDMFHEDIPKENEDRLKLFACFRPDKEINYDKAIMLNLGKAKSLTGYNKKDSNINTVNDIASYFDGISYNIETTLALTVDGDLLADCDYAYDDIEKIKICNVFEDDWFEKLTKILIENENTD